MKIIKRLSYQFCRNHSSKFRCWDCIYNKPINYNHFICTFWNLNFYNSYKLEHDGCCFYVEHSDRQF